MSVAALVLALFMIGLILIPVRLWHHPTEDAVYKGFDPNLIYVNSHGDGSSAGMVDVSPQLLRLTALPASEPTVDLVTSPLSFRASMDLRILQTGSSGTALSLGIWSPSSASGYYVNFGSSPQYSISAKLVTDGAASTTLVGGKVISETLIGAFVPGESYHVSMALDRQSRTITTDISGSAPAPFAGRVLRSGDLAGPVQDNESVPFSVVGGARYNFGGWVNHLAGAEPYAIGIVWSDKQGNALPFPNWWRDPAGAAGWVKRDLQVTAPAEAATATLFLGSGAGSLYLFGDVVVEDANHPGVNLLPNGDFARGPQGWKNCRPPGNCGAGRPADIVESNPAVASLVVNAAEFPELFQAFRPTLAVSLSSVDAIASATIENYVLTLPSQPTSAGELVEKVDDYRAKVLVALLSALGGILCVIAFALSWRTGRLHMFARGVVAIPRWQLARASLAVTGYLLINAYLFHLGTPHFDTYTPEVWSYIAAQYGITQLYHWPLLITAAVVHAGIPWHEAVFPYGPTKAYYYLGVGWLYKLLFSPPGSPAVGTFQLEFLLKTFNVLFALADAALVYLILRRLGAKVSRARQTAGLFALNPALIFIMSVWGSTETISIFFVLLSVWFALRGYAAWAWMTLALGAFTRPQMLVLAFLLGCVYLRRFHITDNVRAISWAVIVFFIVMTPFAITISPSIPFDYVTHILGFSVGTGQADPDFQGTTPGYYSIWTLPLMFINGQSGLQRMWYPRTAHLAAGITYAEASSLVVLAFLIAVGALILVRRDRAEIGNQLPLVAFGVIGWLMLDTGLISRYFLYGIAMLILCRQAVRPMAYIASVTWLSFITLVTAWSHFGLDTLGNRDLTQPLSPVNNPVTHAVLALFSNNAFITLGTVGNLVLLITLGIHAVRLRRTPGAGFEASEADHDDPRPASEIVTVA